MISGEQLGEAAVAAIGVLREHDIDVNHLIVVVRDGRDTHVQMAVHPTDDARATMYLLELAQDAIAVEIARQAENN